MKAKFVILLILFFCAGIGAQTPSIEKVEPPNWWANHTIDPVRLLARGKNLKGASVRSLQKNLGVSNIRTNESGTYIFFDVKIPKNTVVGRYDFEVSTSAGKARIPFEISPPLADQKNFQGISNDDVIYLIMPDRFSNGDTSNDAPDDAPASANGRGNPRAWHGGDFKGVTGKLPYLKELGITAIWLTPWYDNPNTANECDKPWCPYTNYHGYHVIDYYGVEDRFGTMADLREMVEAAHKMGIKVIQDQVANHVGLPHPWIKDPPLKNWINPKKLNSFNNSVLLSPNASLEERDLLLNGWFVDLLPDNNHFEPEVSKYQIQNAVWWIGMTGIDGIRQDTIQYMPREFIRDWSVAIKKQYPGFWMVGEIFEEDSAQTAFFQGGKTGWDGIDTKLPAVFDFKLWRTSQQVFTGNKPARALRDILKYDGLYPDINNVVLLENNHDTDRFMSLKGATKEGAKLHTAFVLATRGIPQLYYGEEILMTGGHDPDNRKDFPGGWKEDRTNKFAKSGRTKNEEEMFAWTQQWIKLRKENPALRRGKTIDLYYDDDAYIFTRFYPRDSWGNIVMVALNASDKPKKIEKNFFVPGNINARNVSIEKLSTGGGNSMLRENRIVFELPPKSASAFRVAY
ncbi:MAG: hypothetical protein HKN25_04120 [Pyrinomonadaceae bacterium]|nr:hypothetical protein [Pyrinomonadaceae bacterium]